MHRETITVSSEIHKKHSHTVWVQSRIIGRPKW